MVFDQAKMINRCAQMSQLVARRCLEKTKGA
jgi:hypothetical protein